MDKSDILTLFPFYENASSGFQSRLLDAVQVINQPPRATYLHEGDTCRVVPFVGRGHLRVFKENHAGREVTLYHVHAGESCLLNICGVLAGTPCEASAIVEAHVEAAVLPAQTFLEFMASSPEMRGFVFSLVGNRVTCMMERLGSMTFQRLDGRLADFLLRHGDGDEHGGPVVHATHEEIAHELGTAREVVSRALKDLSAQGIIQQRRGRIVLLKADCLAQVKSMSTEQLASRQ